MKHHEASIPAMTQHFRDTPGVLALFLTGSVATGTEHEKSDLDGVAVVTPDFYREKEKLGKTCESIWCKCSYDGGYFDIHYKTKDELIRLAAEGAEPMRNMFSCARTLFTTDAQLPDIVAQIPRFQHNEKTAKQLHYYAGLKQNYNYYLNICQPTGFARLHAVNRMVFCLYRLILLENDTLFPSIRKVERTVATAPNKPVGIMELCERLMQSLTTEDALSLVESYEAWTSYDYPTDFQFISNHCIDPYEV